jgi:uncharacterized membrane protein YphA (DoxX/SURF4 family)
MEKACVWVKQYGPLAGRILLALIFVWSGLGKIIHFLKNVTILGGLLYVMAFGAGPLSLDARASQGKEKA